MRIASLSALAVVLLAACGFAEVPTSDPSRTPVRTADPIPSFPFVPTLTSLPPGQTTVLQSANFSLVADDPAEAMSQLEDAVLAVGGFVSSASSWSSPDSPGYASLSARVPPGSLPDLRRAVFEVASQVQSESSYSQDVTAEFRLLHERLQAVALAKNHVWQLLIQNSDPHVAASLAIARDLLSQEETDLQRQLTDYQARASLASFDVTLNAPVATFLME
jgi:hypothetical protein